MFPGECGPIAATTANYLWNKARRAAEVLAVKLHDLRRFYASGLIAPGCDVVTVQRALGHGKPTTTLNTYSHLWPPRRTAPVRLQLPSWRPSLANLADYPRPTAPK
jgi:integrase